MGGDRDARETELFEAALERPAESRRAFLQEACHGDEELLRGVESLLEHNVEGRSASPSDAPTRAAQPAAPPLKHVGPYRLLQKLGEGGMGEVYEAEQEAPFKRRVAVKLVKWGMSSEEVLARFESERQALALMSHPSIARVYDAGATEDGRPYFAMELVAGVAITDYCDTHRLSVEERLELFIRVCLGVQHAHQKGVIHRDIKPSNILVGIEDGRPVPKIIDFGVAKATSMRLTERTLFTQLGQWIGTPAYMSPEQAEMTGLNIDTRTDVYSLGVVLYELLVGALPFALQDLQEVGFDEMRRTIREKEPARPSTRVSSLGAAAQKAATDRRTDFAALARDLRGDLDWVTMKALEKDRARRYGSPAELGDDIERHLHDEPVQASPPTTAYRARKFVRRHRWGVAASAAVVMALLVAIASTSTGWLRPDGAGRRPGIGASGRPSVAVMYFESLSGNEEIRWLSRGLPNMLVTNLAQTPGLDVVSSQRVHEILNQLGQENLASIDKSIVPEVARRAGVGAVVLGSIFESGGEIRIDVQVEDVSSGRVLSAESVRGRDVFPLVDELTDRIRRGLELSGPAEVRSLAEVTTPSLEAFQLYTEGWEAWKNARFDEARRLFEEALEIDPSFALASVAASGLAALRGETSVAREYIGMAYENLDRLPERQSLLVEASYAQLEKDDPAESATILESLLSRYPDEESAYLSLWQAYTHLSEPEKALAVLKRGVTALPRAGVLYNMYGYELLFAGRYPEGIRAFETYARLEPEEPNPHDSLGEAFLITGQPERAIAQYTRALEVAPWFRTSHVGRAFANAVLGRYDEFFEDVATLKEYSDVTGLSPASLFLVRSLGLSRVGRYDEAEAERRAGIEIAHRLDDTVGQAALELLASVHALERGDTASAVDSSSRIEALGAELDFFPRRYLRVAALLVGGTAEARSGDVEGARHHLEAQREIMDERDEAEAWWHHSLQGEIALAAADLEAAERAFAAGEPEAKMRFGLHPGIPWTTFSNCLPFHDGLARVRRAQGDLDAAIELYRDLLTPGMSSKWTAWLEPRYVLRLARLLHESGDTAGARAEYERFLDLWKDADPGLPEVQEARSYLTHSGG